ncbi:MAG: tRNA uridine-5-carboxymethylaminomethyl(34) synthesis GTPase MnmE [Gemmatimonadota bacterium]
MVDDTIVAVSTAPGRAGVALVRISGSEVPRISERLGLPLLEPRRATLCRVRHPEDGRILDVALATRFRAPASYTGQDVLEITCHGGALVPQSIVDAVCAAGGRPAGPGEFTRRAFLNGKLDLVQAEATLDLVDARSEALHRASLFQLEGALSARIQALRDRMLDLLAMLSYAIDFPDEDEGPVPPEKVREAAARLIEELGELLRNAPEGELLREGALTVIAGRPNSGKSSLFNALLGESRAIVTEEPGTTRDAVEALLAVEGYPFRLVDTAGLRTEAGRVESLGIEVARRYLERADLVLYCAEAGREMGEDERVFLSRHRAGGRRVILVRTKVDRVRGWAISDDGPVRGAGGIWVSSIRGTGLDEVRARLVDAAFSGLRSAEREAPFLTRRRQIRAVKQARHEIWDFLESDSAGLPPEVSATHVQEAARCLEELLGTVDAEDVLERVFTQFCIGK